VRITASEIIGVEVLPPMLATLRTAHPGLSFEVGLNNRNEDLLRRQADIAIRMTAPTQKALLAQSVGSVRLGLHAHRRYLDAHGMPASRKALRNHAMIGYEDPAMNARWLPLLGLDVAPEALAFRTDSDLAHLAAIRAGMGIGVCQSALAARDPELVPVLAGEVALDLETWLVMHEDQRALRRVRLAFDHLVQALKAYSGRRPIRE
jgi:DNA-binding transcriptional LysR family regulator